MAQVNLQERLEAILDERRVHVNVDPLRGADYRSTLLHEELGDWLVEACGDDALGTTEAGYNRDNWLVRIAGAVLYLLHPEDVPTSEDERHPGLPSQAGIAHAFTGLNPGMVIGPPVGPVDDGPGRECGHGIFADPDATVYRKGDGTYRRKPRPDRG